MWGTIWAAVSALAAVGGVLVAVWERRRQKEPRDYSVEGEAWVFERGWTFEDLLRRLIDLDYLALAGVELSSEDEGTVEQWAPVFQKSPETWALVVYRGKLVVGYWSYFSVSPKIAERIRSGKLRDSEITSDQVRSIRESGPHVLYFGMIARHPDMTEKGDRSFKLLMKSLLESLEYHFARVDIANVYAVCFSKEAESLCRQFKLEHVMDTDAGKPLFMADRSVIAGRRFGRLMRPRVHPLVRGTAAPT
jgi:hypothetical protein